MLQWIFIVASFLGSLSFYHLMVPRPGGCSFYFLSVLWLFISTFWESKKDPKSWAKEQIDRHCCCCQPFSNSTAGQHY